MTPSEHNSPQSENELIALFMGVKETTGFYDNYGTPFPHYWTGNGLDRTCSFTVPGKSMADFVEKSKYHTSWDWLMPVIQKIYALYDEFDFTSIEQENMFLNVLDNYVKYPLAQHYYHVVEFIKWYNNQTKP